MQNLRKCQVIKHHGQALSHLCLFKDCKKDSRWACNMCLEEFHQHRQSNQDHLMNKQQLIELISLHSDVDDFIQYINQNFLSLTRLQINRIIGLQQQNNKQKPIQSETNCNDGQQAQEQEQEQEKNDSDDEIYDKNMKYTVYFKQSLEQRKLTYYAPQISPNNKFLIVCVNTQLLIFDLNTKQQKQNIQLKDWIQTSIFSDDSKYLFCGSDNGNLLCFKVNRNFKLISRFFNINTDFPKEIILINRSMVLFFSDSKLPLINFKFNKQQQIIKFNHKTKYYKTFDYNQQYQVLIYVWQIIYSDTFFIKFIKIPTLKIILEYKFQKMIRIQLINPYLLLSSDKNYFYIWNINHGKQEISQVKYLYSKQSINYFAYVDTINLIFIYKENQIQIVNSDLQIMSIIRSHLQLCSSTIQRAQTLDYLIIRDDKQLRILKLQTKQMRKKIEMI